MDTKYRQHLLDFLRNVEVREISGTKSKIISYIRHFLYDREFLEVETPMMKMVAGGAAARPSTTYPDELNTRLFKRIAPELYLKELVVSGLDRVFEIGQQFSNEGIDLTYNPELTTCDFYMAYGDSNDVMKLTEDMLSGMVKELTGGYKIKYHANGLDKDPIEIDFTPPFRRIDMINELQKMTNMDIPKDHSSLVAHFLEDACTSPAFIIGHPEIMSHRSNSGLTERFELFINNHKVCNAYTMLNDPIVQRFSDQLNVGRQLGDDEAVASNEALWTALTGLRPTYGWGLAIDQMTMLLTDSQNIKDVMLLFPTAEPQDEPSNTERD